MALSNVQKAAYLINFVGFMDLFGVSLVVPLLTTHIKELGASSTLSGLIGSVYGTIQLFSSPVVGQWSDVQGRRKVLLISILASAAGYAILGVSHWLLIVVLARLPLGLFKHTMSISKAYLADIIPTDEQAKVFGQYNAASSIGFIIGPVVGGHIAEMKGGFYTVSLLAALIFLLNYAIVWCLIPVKEVVLEKSKKTNEERSETKSWISCFHEISWRDEWDIFLVRFLMGFAIMVYRSNYAMVMKEKYDTTPSINGYIISYSGCVAAISGFLVGYIASLYKHNYQKIFFHCLLIQILMLYSLTYAPSLTWYVLSISPLSLSNALSRVCMTKITLQRCKTETGTLLGLSQSVSSTARILSPLIGGMVAEVSVNGPSLVAVACAVLATSVWFTTSNVRKNVTKKQV